jgi:glutathione S-transferase
LLTLYHGRSSVCSLKARLALAEKALNFDCRLLTLRGDQFEPQYLKLNPNAVVPTLVRDEDQRHR